MTKISIQWNLDSLFHGGSQSPALIAAIHDLKHQILHFSRKFKRISDIKIALLHFANLEAKSQDLQYFIECLLSQNVDDQEALKLHNEMIQIKADGDSLAEEINALLAALDESSFQTLLDDEEMQPIAFHLKEKRERSKNKLPVEQEKLIHKLAIDGYQGWNDLYDRFIGQLKIESPLSHEPPLSIGQAENRLSHPDREIRKKWFYRLRETWTTYEELFAQIINHLAGFRLNLYYARHWPSILQEPLFCNRMQEKTLQVMWETIDKHKEYLQKYLHCKAQLLGLKQLDWYDIDASLPGAPHSHIPYDEAAHFITKHFTEFSPLMGKFAEHAFHEKWVEAEDRPGKRPGGFCSPFLHSKQSRIFMTYSGTMNNVFTLAHELGHAYHSYVMKDLPFFAQQYRMNVAETASTLAELVTIDSMIHETKNQKEKLALLDNELQRTIVFLMNIHCRFLFEIDFYKERKKGFVLPQELNLLMEKAQKKAFGNALGEWHPHFWASKQHFYFTEVPFYNFPYTFGYLFSLGIYTHLKKKKNGPEKYEALLRDSGSFSSEELALRHLNVRLDEPHFWETALGTIRDKIDQYVTLAAEQKELKIK